MSRVRVVELLLVELPLVRPFRTSFGEMSDKRCVLVRVETDDAEGWGECVADSQPDFSGEFNGGAWLALRDFLVPSLFRAGDVDIAAVERVFARGPRQPDGQGGPARCPRRCGAAGERRVPGIVARRRARPRPVRREHRDRILDRGPPRAGERLPGAGLPAHQAQDRTRDRRRSRPLRARGPSGHPPVRRRERRVLARPTRTSSARWRTRIS